MPKNKEKQFLEWLEISVKLDVKIKGKGWKKKEKRGVENVYSKQWEVHSIENDISKCTANISHAQREVARRVKSVVGIFASQLEDK